MSGGYLRLLAAVAGALLLPASAFAACTVPAGIAGDIMYNGTYNVLQFCNGTTWINAGSSNASGIGTLTNGDFCTTDGTNINCTTATPLPAASGGTGVANSNTITLGGNVSTAAAFTTSGANSLTLTTTGATNVTLPTSGTLVTTGVTTLSSLVSIGTITTGVWNGTAITVPYGGTGVATLASNGVLYGNGAGVVQVTAQGAANSVLTANAGAPSFSASPTIGTSVTTPLVIGGTAAGSALTLESTSGTGTSDSIVFKTGSQSERMRIDTNGNVGIGTTTPRSTGDMLTVSNPSGSDTFVDIKGSNTAKTYAYMSNDGTNLAYSGLLADDGCGAGNWAVTTGVACALTITHTAGNVGIGSTSPATILDVNGTSRATVFLTSTGSTSYSNDRVYYNLLNNSGVFYVIDQINNKGVYMAANSQAWSAFSDRRLKNIIGPITGSLKRIEEIKPVYYTLKDDSSAQRRVGVIAQDVQKVLPEAITEDGSGYLGLRYTDLIPLAIASIQELKADNDNLRREFEQLRREVRAVRR